jgi:hypothetical protein
MKTNKTFAFVLSLLLACLALSTPVVAQTTVTQTTLSASVAAPGQGSPANVVSVASATNISAGTEIFVDREAMLVISVSSTTLTVQRGYDSSLVGAHASGQLVYVGAASGQIGSPFVYNNPAIGSCTLSSEQWSVRINVTNGQVWACTNGTWLNQIDAYEFLPPTACNSSVSGNSTGTNGYTVLGTAPSIPVVQAQTSNSGTNTHYYTCVIPLPTRLHAAKAAYVVDVVFLYGVQTTALGTQVATLSSGTMNSKTVFQTIGYPVAAASETATGLAEAARADSGSLVITPVVGSFNTATTTAGEFYSAKFAPASPIAMSTDNQQVLFTVSLLNTATSATVTNSPGIYVHYRALTDY